MTTPTPTDTAKLADEIEALAKKYQDAWDYIRAIPRDCQIPFDKMMELESAERAITRACMDKSTTIVAALRELEAAHAREAKLREPEWFYNADDGEYTYGDVNDTVNDMGYEGVMRVGGAREVWVKWAAVKCVALDPDGEVDETEVHTFDTEAEALRCWPDSLAACRARAALGGAG